MNAIDLCKQHKLDNLTDLSMYIVELDNDVNKIKHKLKVDDDKSELWKLTELTSEVKVLQGHLNSLVAKKEILTRLYGSVLANKLVRQLILNTKATIDDIEFKYVAVVCKKGGFELRTMRGVQYFDSHYKNTEVYKTIRCD